MNLSVGLIEFTMPELFFPIGLGFRVRRDPRRRGAAGVSVASRDCLVASHFDLQTLNTKHRRTPQTLNTKHAALHPVTAWQRQVVGETFERNASRLKVFRGTNETSQGYFARGKHRPPTRTTAGP